MKYSLLWFSQSFSARSSICPDCSLDSGRLWQHVTQSQIQSQLGSAKRAGIRILHWADLLQLPSKDVSLANLGNLACEIFPVNWPEVWKSDFDLFKLSSISKKNTIQTICYTSGKSFYNAATFLIL